MKIYNTQQNIYEKILFYSTKPLHQLFQLTIPSSRKKIKNWPYTFIVSIIYFTIFSFVMVYLGTNISCILSIDAEIMGFTLLAIGTSLPDFLGSLAAVRHGHINMAISNTLGSNSFDLYIAIGLPYFLYNIIYQQPIAVENNTLLWPSIAMIFSAILLLVILKISNYRLTKTSGILFASSYLLFLFIIFIK